MTLRISLLLAALAIGALTVVQSAGATHVRPKAATPVRDTLVLAYKGCKTPNNTHQAPLVFPSCTPHVPSSNWLTAGTFDANGAASNQVGHVRVRAIIGPPGPPADSDIEITSTVNDVRCQAGTPASICTPPNNTGTPPDYSGQLEIRIGLRLTDHFNAPSTTPGTAADFTLTVPVNCATTASLTFIGSACSVTTTMNSMVPGSAPEGRRSVFQIPQQVAPGGIQVWDGGSTGVAGATDATPYVEPGVFLP